MVSDKSKLSSRFKQNTTQKLSFKIPSENNNADLKEELMDKIDSVPVWTEFSQDKQKEMIRAFVDNKAKDFEDKEQVTDELYDAVQGFGKVQYLIDNERVCAVFINGTKSVHIEIDGKILNTEIKLSEKELNFILNSVISVKNAKENIINVKKDNFDITVINSNVCVSGTYIVIRKMLPKDLDSFIESGFVSKDIFNIITSAVEQRKNIVISGDINLGKTSFLDVLISEVLNNKRSVLLEDSMQINSQPDGMTKFKYDNDILEYVLKLTPDYLVTDVNKPLLSDYKGLIMTLRAASVEESVKKLTSFVIAQGNFPEKFARLKILNDIDYIVQISRMQDGVVRISSIAELVPSKTAASSVKIVAEYKLS